MRLLLLHIVIISVFSCFCSISQEIIKSNSGTSFFICYPKNYNNDYPSYKSLHLYIASTDSSVVSGSMTYYVNDSLINTTLNIDKDTVVDIKLPISLEILSYRENEKKGIELKTDKPVAIYGSCRYIYSSEAFMCYPLPSIDTFYVIGTYQNSIMRNVGDSDNKYSNFCLSGTEDSTLVTIIPSAPLQYPLIKKGESFSFYINKYETRQFQASIMNYYDLTGSIIYSNKKISVFSSHERASVGHKIGNRDMLVEQTPPVSILGTSAIMTPVYSPSSGLKSICRIIPAFDNTTIYFKDSVKSVNRYDFLEFSIDSAYFIKADKPVLCCLLAYSSYLLGDIGDSFLANIPPGEQYLKSYKVICIPDSAFTEHYLCITIPSGYEKTIILDGKYVQDSIFRPVNGISYKWGTLKVLKGVHKITADTGFGLIIYGNGNADSYGYTGGMKTERLLELIMDKTPPAVLNYGDCNEILELSDDKLYASGIESFAVQRPDNIQTIIPPFQKGVQNLVISLKLVDDYKDGRLDFIVKDKAGNSKSDSVVIKGFTVQAASYKNNTSMNFNELISDTAIIMNYGMFAQNVSLYFKNNTSYSVPPTYSGIILNPGASVKIPFFIRANYIGKLRDELILTDECSRIRAYPIEISVLPKIYKANTSCNIPLHFSTSQKYTVTNQKGEFYRNFEGRLLIYNLTGSKVKELIVKKDDEIDLVELSKGFYILVFMDNNFDKIISASLIIEE